MYKWILTLILALMSLNIAFAADENSPVGYWNTIDDVSGMLQSRVQITENSDHSLTGRVVKIFPHKGQNVNDVCVHCQGALHNQRIWGMTIINGLKKEDSEWSGGTILDPNSGRVYHCIIHVIDNGKKLNVRGYIGIRLLGRTQTWIRTSQ